MPITNDQIAAAPTYTDAEMLKMYRQAMMDIAMGGQSSAISHRIVTRADLPEIRAAIEWLESRVQVATGCSGDGIALAQLGLS